MSRQGGQVPVAVVGVGAVLPDAPDAPTFWRNIREGRHSIREVPPDRWLIEDYFDTNRSAPDKTYSAIGGWVRGFTFDWKRFRIPPRVAAEMDDGQQWAVTAAAEALEDYGHPERSLDTERTGVILGTAMGGDRHLDTHLRVSFPEFRRTLTSSDTFRALPEEARESLLEQWQVELDRARSPITEDTMPGELPNVVAGRVANVLNLRGPSFVSDAACASSLAALSAAVDSLSAGDCDAVLTGGVDHNMSASSFVKFSKIGALSASGSRPFADGADGFVMGEGCVVVLLKRLADAERDGDKIYGVIRGLGSSSDGRGKGITAPNPVGQRLAMERAWAAAEMSPSSVTLVEAHGTSTKVGDQVEAETLSEVFGAAPRGSVALGSVKSNLGHLKGAAGAAGLLKVLFALDTKELPSTLHAEKPNPALGLERTPFYLNGSPKPWTRREGLPRRAAVSAYGFGGTNFHVVLEEHRPGTTHEAARRSSTSRIEVVNSPTRTESLFALGAVSRSELARRVGETVEGFTSGEAPRLDNRRELSAPERLVIEHKNPGELLQRLKIAQHVVDGNRDQAWSPLRARGIFRGSGPRPGKLAFLFPGQGSQYLNMGRDLVEAEPLVAEVFAEADEVMTPILGRPLSDFLFIDTEDPEELRRAERALMDTAVTQPAVLTLDTALDRLSRSRGFAPDLVMGHSLGEYAALVSAGILPMAHALEAAAARGREMSQVRVDDPGLMAAVFAPRDELDKLLSELDGYVVVANLNSHNQCVIGGESAVVQQAMSACAARGLRAVQLPVSHAFHTAIVAPAAKPLRSVLDRLDIRSPQIPVIANVTGKRYPESPEAIKDLLEQQIASPVQWVKGLEALYSEGVRTFVEIGPKKVLSGFTEDVLGGRADVLSLFSNHPKTGGPTSFDRCMGGLLAAGYAENGWSGRIETPARRESTMTERPSTPHAEELGRALIDLLSRSGSPDRSPSEERRANALAPEGSVVISGTGLGLPGAEKPLMDSANVERLLRGESFIDLVPERFRQRMLDKGITRLVKDADGAGSFASLTSTDEVIRLAARPGSFDLAAEYGVSEKLVEACDTTTQMAIAAGLDALCEAGIPLVRTYRETSSGKSLPDRWMLPEPLRDETGVIFASAFPGLDRFADELERYHTWVARRQRLDELEELRQVCHEPAAQWELSRRTAALRRELELEPYRFDRRFLFRVLAMAHSQFGELIGARGPNTQVNAACAGTAQAVSIAEDWIRCGRCRRVVVIAADNVTGDHLMEWIGAGFLAVGAAATDDRTADAALPFDRRRHGLLLGMGCSALVVEAEDALRERGMRGIVELVATEKRNSSHHATRLDAEHISEVLESLVSTAELRFGVDRRMMAPATVFMSHETYTPARGGSASAEVEALRRTFGEAANQIVISNTKGFTGHPMSVGIEDVAAVKVLEHGVVPPVPNHKELDPDLGNLNLSRGGAYPVQYAIRLAAGFGSQVAMSLIRRIPGSQDRIDDQLQHRRWLADATGYDRVETEVVKRTLKVREQGPALRTPMPSGWQFGATPTLRAATPTLFDNAMPLFQRSTPSAHISTADLRPTPQPVAYNQREVAGPSTENSPELRGEGLAPEHEPPHPSPIPEGEGGRNEHEHEDLVAQAVLSLVAEQTGYPQDMLELDLDLEADLGIDTVKQAETFSALRDRFELPSEGELSPRDYPTLAKIVEYVYQSRPELRGEQRTVPEHTAPEHEPPHPSPLPEEEGGRNEHVHMHEHEDLVAQAVLSLVAEQTGYPQDMLELDLDLEADLGIDTVKQAETFSALRDRFELPSEGELSPRDYPTLAKIVEYVYQSRPELRGERLASGPIASGHEVPEHEAPHPSPLPEGEGEKFVHEHGSEGVSRRVPVAMVRPPSELGKLTGVSLEDGGPVLIMPDEGGVGRALGQELVNRKVEVIELAHDPDELQSQLAGLLEGEPIQGLFWLPALDSEPVLEEMDLERWRRLLERRVKNLYTTTRALFDTISERGRFLIAATRLGGCHGYDEIGATAPMGGAVSGFVKAYGRERPDALVKVVDFAEGQDAETLAATMIDETLADPGTVEVGHRNGLRYGVILAEQELGECAPAMDLHPGSVFVVSGAAGGVTSAIISDLAEASGGEFYLLDLQPPPRRNHPHLSLLLTDREALMRELGAELEAANVRPTPLLVEQRLMALEREEAAARTIESVEAAGGIAHYRQLDLMDPNAVEELMELIRRRHGRIDVLLHAAGLEISRGLPQKTREELDRVFDVKADGLFNLMRSAKGLPIEAVVAFGSIAGRFGNRGQVDYSAANDLLCKVMSSLRRWRPDTRGIAIDWTAWADIGMASRGTLPRILTEAGIDLLSPAAGVPIVRRELTQSTFSGELLVGGRLGVLVEPTDPDGGLDLDFLCRRLTEGDRPFLSIGELRGARYHEGALEIELEIDPTTQPFLTDHQVENGVPYLPGVVGTEYFAELASLLAPALSVAHVRDVEFSSPMKFHRNQPRTLRFRLSGTAAVRGSGVTIEAVLDSVLPPPHPDLPPRTRRHFSASLQMTRSRSSVPPVPSELTSGSGNTVARGEIYETYFHGPAYRVLEEVRLDGDRAVGRMASNLPPETLPQTGNSVLDPRLIELCFQTAGLWEMKSGSGLGLPQTLHGATLYERPEKPNPDSPLYALVEAREDGEVFDAKVVDESGQVYVALDGYRTVELGARRTR